MSTESTRTLKSKAEKLPAKPGIYFFKDAGKDVIYIGKARSLRDRVKSYFLPTSDPKIENILSETSDIDFILTDSEREAAFLENNFIRQSQPKFNIKLKDDKSFPYLKITLQERFPGVYLTRRVENDGAKYFGPYSPAHQARKTIQLLAKHFGVRTCTETVPGKRRRPCLEHDLDMCAAPCTRFITEKEYGENVENARYFLEGKVDKLSKILEDRMKKASERQDFEQAAHWRDFLFTLDQIKEKPKLISVQDENEDIFGYARSGGAATLYVFIKRRGRVVESESLFTHIPPDASDEMILGEEVQKFYKIRLDFPETVLLPFSPKDKNGLIRQLTHMKQGKLSIHTPLKGRKRKLVELAGKNASNLLEKKFSEPQPLKELMTHFRLDRYPEWIEGYDISNTGGSESVGSLVVFRHGQPLKDEYRKYKIQTLQGPDDVASLKEVIHRRYTKVLEGKKTAADLMLIDGGKGQLNAAFRALEELGIKDIPIVSLAKKQEMIFSAIHKDGLLLERTSPALLLLQRIRDEAHRFAITFHRQRREKKSFQSLLDGVTGIGQKRKQLLQSKFRNIKEIKTSGQKELEQLIGKKAAAELQRALKETSPKP